MLELAAAVPWEAARVAVRLLPWGRRPPSWAGPEPWEPRVASPAPRAMAGAGSGSVAGSRLAAFGSKPGRPGRRNRQALPCHVAISTFPLPSFFARNEPYATPVSCLSPSRPSNAGGPPGSRSDFHAGGWSGKLLGACGTRASAEMAAKPARGAAPARSRCCPSAVAQGQPDDSGRAPAPLDGAPARCGPIPRECEPGCPAIGAPPVCLPFWFWAPVVIRSALERAWSGAHKRPKASERAGGGF